MIEVEVVYALPQRQEVRSLKLDDEATAVEAVRQSGLLAAFPEISAQAFQLGVFGKPVTPDHRLSDGDRVELYRALSADADALRRRRRTRPQP